jgi:hypothetical protein
MENNFDISQVAFREFFELLSASLNTTSNDDRILPDQYWEYDCYTDKVDVYLELNSLDRTSRYNTPLSKVWVFNDQQRSTGGKKYDAVYAFFPKTEQTRKGTYRWKIDQKTQRDTCIKMREWVGRYQEKNTNSSETIDWTPGNSSSRKGKKTAYRKHVRSGLNTQREPWIERRLPEPTMKIKRAELSVLPSSARHLGPGSDMEEGYPSEYSSRELSYEEAADVRKDTTCKDTYDQ